LQSLRPWCSAQRRARWLLGVAAAVVVVVVEATALAATEATVIAAAVAEATALAATEVIVAAVTVEAMAMAAMVAGLAMAAMVWGLASMGIPITETVTARLTRSATLRARRLRQSGWRQNHHVRPSSAERP